MEETPFRSNFTAPFPNGVAYYFATRRHSSYILHHPDRSPYSSCSLMDVIILNNAESFPFPCFSCSGFATIENYHNDFHSSLADAISNAVVLPSPHCAATIAQEILRSALIPAIDSHPDNLHQVIVRVQAPLRDHDEHEEQEEEYYEEDENEDDVNRVLGESFEEAGPQRKPCKMEAVIEMVTVRDELEALEGEKAESDWKESGSHDCVICIEEIDSIWESLKTVGITYSIPCNTPCSTFLLLVHILLIHHKK